MLKKTALLFLLAASGLMAQTMILTSSYISTLKARAAANSVEWQQMRSSGNNDGTAGCDYWVQYTANTPDHLPPIYASQENYSDGYGNDNGNAYILVGTDSNEYEGMQGYSDGRTLALCYLVLKDGDVTPTGWSFTWNGIRLTPQQYGILAGMQAIKLLNKTTPTFPHIAPSAIPNNWGGLAWRAPG